MSAEPQSAPAPANASPVRPPDVSIRARPPSPKRLSRKVLLAGALASGAITAYAVFTGLSEQRPQNGARAPDNSAAATATPPETIAQASSDYDPSTLQAPHDMLWGAHPPPDAGGVDLQPPSNPNFTGTGPNPVRAQNPTARAPAVDPRQAARTAPILFSEHSVMSPPVRAGGANAGGTITAGGRSGFLAQQRGAQDDQLAAVLQPPRSRNMLQAGAVIAGALITELNSDLPGRVIAQVTAPVYDSVTGTQLLIPQGARLIGSYDSVTTHGDNRIFLAWNRIVFPNGWSIDLAGMEATDPAGAAGLRDRTDNHLGPLAGAIGLASVFSVLANNAEDDGGDRSSRQTVGDAAAQQAAQTGGRIVDRDLQVHPTLRVRVGAPVRVLVTRDILLRPYRAR